ncbi:MAG: hypothetical protein AAF663_00590 [Planctomycetota bacterium]
MDNADTAFVVATTIYRGMGGRDFDRPEAIFGPTGIDRAEKLATLLNREGCWGVFEALVGDWDDRLLWPEQVTKLADYTDDDDPCVGDADIALAQAHFACCHWAERLNLSLSCAAPVGYFVAIRFHEDDPGSNGQPAPIPLWQAVSEQQAADVRDGLAVLYECNIEDAYLGQGSWEWETMTVEGRGAIAATALRMAKVEYSDLQWVDGPIIDDHESPAEACMAIVEAIQLGEIEAVEARDLASDSVDEVARQNLHPRSPVSEKTMPTSDNPGRRWFVECWTDGIWPDHAVWEAPNQSVAKAVANVLNSPQHCQHRHDCGDVHAHYAAVCHEDTTSVTVALDQVELSNRDRQRCETAARAWNNEACNATLQPDQPASADTERVENDLTNSFYPPRYFPDTLTADTLSHARRDGRIRGRQNPQTKRWHYFEADVRRVWPEHFAQQLVPKPAAGPRSATPRKPETFPAEAGNSRKTA